MVLITGWLQRLVSRFIYFLPGGFSLRPALHRWRGVHIGQNVWISQHVYIDEIHPKAVSIGDNCTIGLRSSIIAHIYWGPIRGKESANAVTIEADVFIGPHCVILPGVRIGRGAVIKAGTVVSRDVPPDVLYGGDNPRPLARVTIPMTPPHSYEEFVRGLRPLKRKGNSHEHG